MYPIEPLALVWHTTCQFLFYVIFVKNAICSSLFSLTLIIFIPIIPGVHRPDLGNERVISHSAVGDFQSRNGGQRGPTMLAAKHQPGIVQMVRNFKFHYIVCTEYCNT